MPLRALEPVAVAAASASDSSLRCVRPSVAAVPSRMVGGKEATENLRQQRWPNRVERRLWSVVTVTWIEKPEYGKRVVVSESVGLESSAPRASGLTATQGGDGCVV